ncbi:hypothetical protein V6N11_084352 [Hibiscus sabdariffa]|uniref:Reverse transcriptase Ty1/copia-type domain-containing protein n=1 Tax=Hibiscus sabdariffa TaxID=183260 RepID=A0ABR2QSS1_9ROSI
MDGILDVGCLVLTTMTPELQKQHEYMVAYEMIQNLKEILKGKHNNRDQDEPKTYQEAVASPDSEKWLEAMTSEMDSMSENQVWILVKPPEGINPIGCKWVLKKKSDMDGNVHTYKGRLVAKGLRQIHGVDYDETFSPVAMFKSIRIFLVVVAFHDYEIWLMDIKTAFLNEKLEEDVYITQPEGFVTPENAGKANPGEGHWTAIKNILKYLRRTKDLFLVYGGEEELGIRVTLMRASKPTKMIYDRNRVLYSVLMEQMLPLRKQRNPDLIIDPNILLTASISYDEMRNMKGVSESFCSLVYSGGLSRDLDELFVDIQDPSKWFHQKNQSRDFLWIYARIDRPGRPWKQQYSESRSCTEATLKAKTQNLSKQNTSREISARADKDKYRKGIAIESTYFSEYPGSMSVSKRRQKDSQSQRLEAQAH